MKCYSCNKINNTSAFFCVECGAPFYKKCSMCNEPSLFSYKFCPKCGTPFDAQLDTLNYYKRKLIFFDMILTYNSIDHFVEVKKNGLYGVFNVASQELIIPCEFESSQFDSKDYIILKKNDKWHIYNPQTGSKLCNDSFEEIKKDKYESYARVKFNGLWGIISCVNGAYAVPPIYDELDTAHHNYYSERYILAKKNGLWGCLEYYKRSTPTTTIPFEYLELHTWAGEDKPRPSLHRNKKYGVILSNGTKILDFEYDEIIYHEPFGHSLYYLRKGSFWGLFYSGGKYGKDVFYPCVYRKDQLNNLKV